MLEDGMADPGLIQPADPLISDPLPLDADTTAGGLTSD